MNVEAKIREDMKALGCNSDSKIALACYLYIHLVDDKRMYDTEYCYNRDIDTLYVVARPRKDEKPNIYVPIATQDMLSVDFINKIQENLCTVETGPTVNLAFIEGDFTTVIYTFTKGLVNRESQEEAKRRREKEYIRSCIDSELQKYRDSILEAALNGGVIDDDDCEVLE